MKCLIKNTENKRDVNWNKILVLIVFFCILEFIALKSIATNLVTSLDNNIANLMAEHWYRTLRGIEKASDLGVFYPIEKSVGIIDMMLHLGVPYTVFRFLGMDMYFSFLISAVFVHLFGSLGLFYLLRCKFKCVPMASMIGVAVFSVANSYMVHLGHIYLLAISFVPILFILGWKVIGSLNNGKELLRYGIFFVSILAILCYSSVYIAQFFLLFIVVYGICELYFDYFFNFIKTKELIHSLRKNWGILIIIGLFGIVLMIPFGMIYIPFFVEQSGGYLASDVLGYAPTLADFWNVGSTNIIYGSIISQLGIMPGETTVGIPLIESFAVIACFIIIFRQGINKNTHTIKAIAVATVLCWGMTLKISGNFSLLILLKAILPGFGSMRAIARFCIFLMCPIGILMGWFSDYLIKAFQKVNVRNSIIRGVGIAAIALLLIENATTLITSNNWGVEAFERIENSNSVEPPPECKSFFVVDSSDREYSIGNMYSAAIQAWSIGYKYNVKTINGIGSIFPYESQTVYNIYEKNYIKNIYNWIIKYGLEGVYCYDINKNQWIESYEYFQNNSCTAVINNGISSQEFSDSLKWNWVTARSATFYVENFLDDKECKIHFGTASAPDDKERIVEVFQDDKWIYSFVPGEEVILNLNIKDRTKLSFETSGELVSLEGDSRNFAFMIIDFSIDGKQIDLS